jgi:hypothetical protein
MKSWLWRGMLAAAIALPALSGVARADDHGCSNATLEGEYAFAVTAYTPPGLPNGPPAVRAGIKTFDGKGTLTQRDYRGDGLRTPPIQTDFSPEGQETGTYTVNSDCTGSAVINLNVPGTLPPHGVIQIEFVISSGGRHIHEVVSEFTPPGFTTPQPTQTSADDWKVVGSEQQN